MEERRFDGDGCRAGTCNNVGGASDGNVVETLRSCLIRTSTQYVAYIRAVHIGFVAGTLLKLRLDERHEVVGIPWQDAHKRSKTAHESKRLPVRNGSSVPVLEVLNEALHTLLATVQEAKWLANL